MKIAKCFICGEKIAGKVLLVENNLFNSEMDQLVSKYREKKCEENGVNEGKRGGESK
jgi:hypothetical protein